MNKKNKFIQVSKLINNKTFIFKRESKENGELYGSIKPKEITNLIMEQSKAEVSPSQIVLKDNLDKIGNFKVEVSLHADVKANISVKITKIETKYFSTDQKKVCNFSFYQIFNYPIINCEKIKH